MSFQKKLMLKKLITVDISLQIFCLQFKFLHQFGIFDWGGCKVNT